MPTIIDGTTGVDQIQNGTVTVNKIANGAVTDVKIADGAVTAAKLAVGAVPAPTTAQVLAATAGAEVGAVGTYAFLASWTNMVNLDAGGTRAGSELKYAAVSALGTTALSGTWRLIGRITTASAQASTSLWLRIS